MSRQWWQRFLYVFSDNLLKSVFLGAKRLWYIVRKNCLNSLKAIITSPPTSHLVKLSLPNICWICALSRTSLADGCRSLSYKVVFNRGVTCKALIYSDLWSAVAKSLNSLYCDSLYFRPIFLWVSNECTDFFFSCVGHAKQFEDLRFRDTHSRKESRFSLRILKRNEDVITPAFWHIGKPLV